MTIEVIAQNSSERRFATIALMTATAMQAADATLANVALPQLERDLGGGIELGAWVMTGYLCAAAVMVPLTGWLRRRLGPRRLYTFAVGLFVVGALLCSLAWSGRSLIAFRIVQGAGGGVLPALAQAVLLDIYPRERHPRILAIWGAAAMVGPILGPAIGGIITDLASWRWAFAINLPLGAAVLWGARQLLPESEDKAGAPLDVVGIVLLIFGVGALQLCLDRAVGRAWLQSPELIGEASIALIALGVTAARARRSGPTILRFDVFKDVNFATAAFLNFSTSALLFTAIVFLPILVQAPLGYPPTLAGFTIVPRAVFMLLIVLAVGPLVRRIDHRVALGTGSVLIVIGLMLLSEIRPANSLSVIVFGSTVQAMGAGIVLIALNNFAYATLPTEKRTDAAGLFSLLRQLGCASGVVLMTAILQVRIIARMAGVSAGLDASAAPDHLSLLDSATLRAYADCFRIMAIAALVVIPGTFFFRLDGVARPIKPAV